MLDTKLDPAEAAARELAHAGCDRVTGWSVEHATAIIRRHLNDHLQSLHGTVMNLPVPQAVEYWDQDTRMPYKEGHRDARHAAAEAIITSLKD